MNPWNRLDERGPDYVLPEDLSFIDTYNYRLRKCGKSLDRLIRKDRIPEPRQGPVNAPIVLLQLNPSFDKSYINQPLEPADAQSAIERLRDEQSPHACIENASGWWGQSFKQLMQVVGPMRLAKRICSIEFFPYVSASFAHSELRLPSQSYTFQLVHDALEREALILVTRGLDTWIGSVPELARKLGEIVFETKNPRRAFISEGNLPEGVYTRVLDCVR